MDRFYLKDPGGVLMPEAVRELAPHFRRRGGRAHRPSCTATARSGSRRSSTSRASRAGFQAVHTALRAPLARDRRSPRSRAPRATSKPPASRTQLDLRGAGRRVASTSPRSPATRACRRVSRGSSTPPTTSHQLPGGMVTTTRRMLDEIRRPELFDAVLGGGHARARGDGLSDHRHAGLAVRRHPGDATT